MVENISVLANPHNPLTKYAIKAAINHKHMTEFLFLPVAAGMWKQHELWDGTYTLDDLLDAAELIQVRRENETRAAEAVRE